MTWDPLIPDEVNPPILKQGVVQFSFKVLPNGQVTDMQLVGRSGDTAWTARPGAPSPAPAIPICRGVPRPVSRAPRLLPLQHRAAVAFGRSSSIAEGRSPSTPPLGQFVVRPTVIRLPRSAPDAACAADPGRFRPAPAALRRPACAASAAPARRRSCWRSSAAAPARSRRSSRR
jgi:hypothetical protein